MARFPNMSGTFIDHLKGFARAVFGKHQKEIATG
jgi:hypothetical protein